MPQIQIQIEMISLGKLKFPAAKYKSSIQVIEYKNKI